MKTSQQNSYYLENFEGPLEFLIHLIQKNEIDIFNISLRKVTEQYLAKTEENQQEQLDVGAEFVGSTAYLLWLKSRTLLPKHEQTEDLNEEELTPQFDMIHQLIDYCRFKEAAKELTEREMQQSAFYRRGQDGVIDVKKTLGIAHLSLEDLASLFQQILTKASAQKGVIHEEEWKVSDKIKAIRQFLKEEPHIVFEEIFSANFSKNELIVTFLAVLELMKMGEIWVVKDEKLQKILITRPIEG